ncbi:MAG: recombinase family protein [Treponema sp.]|jgi:DNA invertase Pin-like site-specific DNA recombinase|uniref:recombinase family protein n=1 Tax=Treponema sp. TaxID=166 RepID=UPI002A916416|nr:recombinase family protein [Treponema sp.]MDY6397179.1 recombinase family protein [Treponema sp.]
MVYGYIRVSTAHQNLENQQLEIERFAAQNGIHIDKWIEEKISGTKKPELRKLGKILMNQCKEGDLVVSTEISRFGRSLIMIMNILQYFLERNIKVWTIKDNYRLGNDIQSKVLAFAFGLSAEIERQLISERTKQGLVRAKAEGKKVGRRPGQKSTYYKLSRFDDYIKEEFLKGRSKSSLAAELGVAPATLRRHIKRICCEL